MKLFKINEKDREMIKLIINELPIKHGALLKGIIDILEGLEEFFEPKVSESEENHNV